MKGLNLAQFEKVKEDKNTVHMKHKDGHVIMIALAALPKIQREQIKRLKMAQGGEVGVHSPTKEQGVSEAGKDVRKVNKNNLHGTFKKAMLEPTKEEHRSKLDELKSMPNPKLQGLADGGNIQPQPTPTPVPLNPQDAQVAQASMRKAFNYDNGGKVKYYADDDSLVSNDDSSVSNDDSSQPAQPSNPAAPSTDMPPSGTDYNSRAMDAWKQYGNAMNGYNSNVTANKNMLSRATDNLRDYQKQHPMDSDQYLKNMNTEQKITSGIGLFLGGMSVPFGGHNFAQDFLNDQINRNVSAQKQNFENNKTVWGAYQSLFNDNNTADNLTKVNELDKMNNRINELAVPLHSPAANQRAASLINSNNAQKDQLLTHTSHALAQKQNNAPVPTPPPQNPSMLPQWIQNISPWTKAGSLPSNQQSVSVDQNLEKVPNVPVPQFGIDMQGINMSKLLGRNPNAPVNSISPAEAGEANTELAKVRQANDKLKLIHQNFGEMWKNRSDSNAALKWLSGLGANIGGAHLALPDMTGWSEPSKNYYRAASTIENELSSLVGSGGLTEAQANTIRTKYIKNNDTPEDFKNVLKSVDNNFISNIQTPILTDKIGKVSRPKIRE